MRAGRGDAAGETLVPAIAAVSTAVVVMSTSVAVALLALRSGLGTPLALLGPSFGVVVSAAYGPFLLPRAGLARLDRDPSIWALMVLAVLASPVLFLWLPPVLAHGYLVVGAVAAVRALPHLRVGWRAGLALVGAAALLGLHLLLAQGVYMSVFLPELMTLGRFSGDPYLHAAIASMIRLSGTPSTGVDGLVPFHYHAGSHYWFAALGVAGQAGSAEAYLVGRTVFMLPAFFLALLVAAVTLAPVRPPDGPLLVVLTTVTTILTDSAKADSYTYRSESQVFGVAIFLLALPLLDRVVRGPTGTPGWARWLVMGPALVAAAVMVKSSAGLLLALVACYALARRWPRSPAALAGVLGMAAAGLAILRHLAPGLAEFVRWAPLGFFRRQGDFAVVAVVGAGALAGAVIWPALARARGTSSRGWVERVRCLLGSGLSWEELLGVGVVAALAPAMVQWGFEVWHFVDLLWWWALTLVLGRLSRDTLRPGWQWLRASAAGLAVLAVGVAIATPLLLRGFPLGDVLAAGREMVAGLEPEAARGLAAGSGDVRRLLQSSVARHGVLVSPDLAGAIRNAFGARAVELVRRAAGPDGPRGFGVHVPPGNERFWRYAVDCRSQPMFLPALAGVPMVLGLPPSTSPCLFPRTYGYADYGPTSRSRDLGPSDLCRHARSQGLHRVFLLRDVDRPEANQLLRCDPAG